MKIKKESTADFMKELPIIYLESLTDDNKIRVGTIIKGLIFLPCLVILIIFSIIYSVLHYILNIKVK